MHALPPLARALRYGSVRGGGGEVLEHVVDAVVDSGDCGAEPTTVIDYSGGTAEVVRRGMGDPARFE